jgi:hypothetical protein
MYGKVPTNPRSGVSGDSASEIVGRVTRSDAGRRFEIPK